MIIEPESGVVLVELAASNHGELPIGEQYNEITQGRVLAISSIDEIPNSYLIDRTVYFRQFKSDCQIFDKGRKLALIEKKDILGSSYAPKDTPT